jgi:hypothetical protein
VGVGVGVGAGAKGKGRQPEHGVMAHIDGL